VDFITREMRNEGEGPLLQQFLNAAPDGFRFALLVWSMKVDLEGVSAPQDTLLLFEGPHVENALLPDQFPTIVLTNYSGANSSVITKIVGVVEVDEESKRPNVSPTAKSPDGRFLAPERTWRPLPGSF
jgi:hypothetical protein